jgi:hypothetical protein
MNDLEKAICDATDAAYDAYEQITGYWLWHSPEHFLQNWIFRSLGQEHGFEVYAEATTRKIETETGRRRRGRPRKKAGKRYDLIVWRKTKSELRAVIEIKRIYSATVTRLLQEDAQKVTQAVLDCANPAAHGYLLIYTEIPRRLEKSGVLRRFDAWAKALGFQLRSGKICGVGGKDWQGKEWISGYCLLRTSPSLLTDI